MTTPSGPNSTAAATQTATITGSSIRRRASLAVQNASASQIAITNNPVTRSIATKYPELKKSPMPESGPELEADEEASTVTRASRWSVRASPVGPQRLRSPARPCEIVDQVQRTADDNRSVASRQHPGGV